MTFGDSASGNEQDPSLGVEPMGEVTVNTVEQRVDGPLPMVARDVGVQIDPEALEAGGAGRRCGRRGTASSSGSGRANRRENTDRRPTNAAFEGHDGRATRRDATERAGALTVPAWNQLRDWLRETDGLRVLLGGIAA